MGSLNQGGAEVLLLDVCNNVNDGELNLVLIHRKDGQLKKAFQQTAIPLFKLCSTSPIDVGYFIKLRKLIVANNIQLIHTHQALDAVASSLATLGLSVPVVFTLHGHGLTDSLFSRILRYWAIRWSTKVLFVSHAQQLHYLHRYKTIRQGKVLPNGIDFKKNFPRPDFLNLGDKSGMVSHELLLGSVGNFTSGRDQLTICKFLSLLKAQGIPFKFLFVGAPSQVEPELYEQCVAYCEAHGLSEQVLFLGSRSNVPEILPQLDAFIYSSVHDTFGIALIEAIASGIPVFVNDWGVMREVTNEGAWATLYVSKDTADLLAKFLDFYAHQDIYRERSKRHARQVRDRYNIEKYLTKLRHIYGQLLTNTQLK
nr:glycosyltransferase family 4 protein [Rhabdobacter roseus]